MTGHGVLIWKWKSNLFATMILKRKRIWIRHKYIFPFLDIHHSLVNQANLETFSFIFRTNFVFGFRWWTKSIWLLFKNVNSVQILQVLNREWRVKSEGWRYTMKDSLSQGFSWNWLGYSCHVLHFMKYQILLYNRMHIILRSVVAILWINIETPVFHKWFFYFQWWRNNVNLETTTTLVSMSRIKWCSRCTNSLQLSDGGLMF